MELELSPRQQEMKSYLENKYNVQVDKFHFIDYCQKNEDLMRWNMLAEEYYNIVNFFSIF
jgi:hypothetical protein